MLKAVAMAGLAPRRAARPHHSWNPTRWARLGAKTAMSLGTPSSVSGHLDVGGVAHLVLGHSDVVVLGSARRAPSR